MSCLFFVSILNDPSSIHLLCSDFDCELSLVRPSMGIVCYIDLCIYNLILTSKWSYNRWLMLMSMFSSLQVNNLLYISKLNQPAVL